jgi:two-component sensor histidine kinase/Tfp pilus assembly protein PilF
MTYAQKSTTDDFETSYLLAEKYLKTDLKKARSNAVNALEYARLSKNEHQIARANLVLGKIYRLQGDLKLAVRHFENALEFKSNDTIYAVSMKEAGIAWKQLNRYDIALDYYLKAFEMFRMLADTVEMSRMKNNIGRLFYSLNDLNQAEVYYRESLRLCGSKNQTSRAIALHNIGSVFHSKHISDSAVYYYRQALKGYELSGDRILIAYGYASLGRLMEDKDSAEFLLRQSYDIRKELHLKADLLESSFYLAELYAEKGKSLEALQLMEQTYAGGLEENNYEYSLKSAEKLTDWFYHMGRTPLAYFYQTEVLRLRDSLYQRERGVKEMDFDLKLKHLEQEKRLSEMENRDKERILELQLSKSELNYERRLQFFWLIIVLLSVFSAASILIFYFRQRNKNKELTRINALLAEKSNENELLMRELHHRVKNNLQAIMSMIRMERRKSTADLDSMTENLEKRLLDITYVHQILYSFQTAANIPLNIFLDSIAKRLLSIYNMENVTLEIKGDADIDTDDALAIGQIFNELITNSCKHGLQDKLLAEIKIDIREENKSICFIYSDNGTGIRNNSELSGEGFGQLLINTSIRKLKGSFKNIDGDGYICSIQIPK